MYPDPRVSDFIEKNFVPVRFHVKTHPDAMVQFGVNWTPTVVVADGKGGERHRIEGFLPVDDFLAQLHLGLAHLAFKSGKHQQAQEHFEDVVTHFPGAEAAAEALYWAGVARYKVTNDAGALKDTAAALTKQYSDSAWAKKASVWG